MSISLSSRRRHTRCSRDWSSDVCSSDLVKSNTNRVNAMPGNISEIKHGASEDRQNVLDRRKDIRGYCWQWHRYTDLLSIIRNKPYQAEKFLGSLEFMRRL